MTIPARAAIVTMIIIFFQVILILSALRKHSGKLFSSNGVYALGGKDGGLRRTRQYSRYRSLTASMS
jgi:hypothetical protein